MIAGLLFASPNVNNEIVPSQNRFSEKLGNHENGEVGVPESVPKLLKQES